MFALGHLIGLELSLGASSLLSLKLSFPARISRQTPAMPVLSQQTPWPCVHVSVQKGKGEGTRAGRGALEDAWHGVACFTRRTLGNVDGPETFRVVCFMKIAHFLPWLLWLSGLSAGLRTKGSPVQLPVRAQAWVAGQVPSRGRTSSNTH